jgi:DNA modification methylase
MKPFLEQQGVTIYCGDCIDVMRELPEESVNCVVTSPPYWQLRDYGINGQIGLEATLEDYIGKLVAVFREVRRLLAPDGTCWVNLGDTYATRNHGVIKRKDLCGLPWRVAFALQDDGWHLRSDVVWHKPNPMPTSQKDRPTLAHEYLFLLTKNVRYQFNIEAPGYAENCIESNRRKLKMPDGWDTGPGGHGSFHRNGREKGKADNATATDKRNRRSVWRIPIEPFAGAHFATFPRALITPCIAAGCPEGGTVLDPFVGSGTTALVARNLNCRAIGIELNPEYCDLAARRFVQQVLF